MAAAVSGRRPLVLCLMGPTGAGKTDLAVALREHLPVDIVSVDSAMVYRGLDIGTAKPDRATLARAPHRLIDICEPSERYSAGRFRDDASRAIAEIHAAGRLPLLVGGTGLYFRALLEGLAPLPPGDAALRAVLERRLARVGAAALHRQLAAVDPEAAVRVHPNDPQRIMRALEVYALTGRPWSAWLADHPRRPPPWRVTAVVLAPAERAVLHRRLRLRFESMVARGLLDEVAALRARGDVDAHSPSMRLVGYRQAWRHLAGELGREEMVSQGVAATRQLARRQLTWLRGQVDAPWVDSEAPDVLARVLACYRRQGVDA